MQSCCSTISFFILAVNEGPSGQYHLGWAVAFEVRDYVHGTGTEMKMLDKIERYSTSPLHVRSYNGIYA